MRFHVDPWSPEMGSSFEAFGEPEADQAEVPKTDVEVTTEDWAGIRPRRDPAGDVLFVDGVRRVDARIWIEPEPDATTAGPTGGGPAVPGYCASYAAGVVRCSDRAEVVDSEIARGIFSPVHMDPVVTPHARWVPKRADGPLPTDLSNGIQSALRQLEVEVTERAGEADLTVVDGSLRGRQHVRGVVGYVKSHWVRYLPAELEPTVAGLAAGERTPLFLIEAEWSRYSWYLRLAPPTPSPWSGIVRCEIADHFTAEAAAGLADLTAATLPRFASSPHKDPRAPQNLVPIGGLEARLRRSLGDSLLLHRGLSQVAGRLAIETAR